MSKAICFEVIWCCISSATLQMFTHKLQINYYFYMFYVLFVQKLKLKTKFFCCWHFDFVIHFKKEDKKCFLRPCDAIGKSADDLECYSAPCRGFDSRSRPMWKKHGGVQKHSNRVMGYRVCQLILCHNNILKHIGEWPNSLDWRPPKLNSE